MWLAWKKNKQRRRAAPHRQEVALWGLAQRRVDTSAWASLSSCPSGAAWRTKALAPAQQEVRFAAARKGPTRGAGSYALDGAAPDRPPQDTLAVDLSLVWKRIHAQTSHTSTKILRTPNRNSAAPDLPVSRQGRRRARRDVRLRASSLLWTPPQKTSSRSDLKLA
jgi:hypothetical protein